MHCTWVIRILWPVKSIFFSLSLFLTWFLFFHTINCALCVSLLSFFTFTNGFWHTKTLYIKLITKTSTEKEEKHSSAFHSHLNLSIKWDFVSFCTSGNETISVLQNEFHWKLCVGEKIGQKQTTLSQRRHASFEWM